MKAVIQRVRQSSVRVENETVGKINGGLMVLIGVSEQDSEKDAEYLAEKIVNLRIFEDENKNMNLSLIDIRGEMLVVSQFTLLGDCRKGRRPSFVKAAKPDKAKELYEFFVTTVEKKGVSVATGRFRAMMDVELINHGPVTFVLES
jgi:D-aminoacyl-tRNA deacylase